MSSTASENCTTIAIIGGGVSGTLVAANLLRHASEPLHVVVIERRLPLGRGVAYQATDAPHLLNVTADRMGIWPDEPGHFVSWLRAHAGESGIPEQVRPNEFLPRRLFGTYVERVFEEMRAHASPAVTFELRQGEVVDIDESTNGGGTLILADGATLHADCVVLALGNLPGEYPIPRPLPIYHSKQYVHVPWRSDAFAGLSADDDILLIGQGLTAVDIIIQLAERGHRGCIHALSRHGLHPRVHRACAGYPPFLANEPIPTSIRQLVRRVREEVRAATRAGSDRRAVIDGMRPYTQAIWLALPVAERARFMRHVRPLWEVHRHRIAPQIGAIVQRLVAAGKLVFHAGRLQTLEADDNSAYALIRRRGSIQHLTVKIKRVLNCTGPRTDYSKYQHPLFIHLLARGLIDHDPLALGINALPTGEVLRYRGGPIPWLFTLGAPLRGIVWESTAVPEIRAQASAIARALLSTVTPQLA